MRVAGKLHWLHDVLVTPLLTWRGAHPNRGKQAFDAFRLLTAFAGTLIHDGWKPYRELACQHGLCNAHHLRELTYVFEHLGQAWAKGPLIELLLVAACHEVATAGAPLPAERIAHYHAAYDQILYPPGKPPIRARHLRANAAGPSRARRSTSSTACASMPTMSGAS